VSSLAGALSISVMSSFSAGQECIATGEKETPRWRSALLSSHWSILTTEKTTACFSLDQKISLLLSYVQSKPSDSAVLNQMKFQRTAAREWLLVGHSLVSCRPIRMLYSLKTKKVISDWSDII
jgi:hypothetical protein